MKIEVLVATIGQNDFLKYKEMNLNTDAIFANQNNVCKYEEINISDSVVKMVTTNQRGVGKNRNIALMYSSADICLLADDDMIYENDYENIVKEAFEKLPEAGIIIFNIETIGKETRSRRNNSKIKRIHKFNSLNYGAARIAFRRDELLKKNIWFSMLYGGGAPYSAGEDSLFLIEAINKGIKIYTYPEKIANIKQEVSTWFTGYNDKYFIDRGIWIANAFPIIKYMLALYYSVKLKNSTNKSFVQILKLILYGIKKFNAMNI